MSLLSKRSLFVSLVCRFNYTSISFQQLMGILTKLFVGVDH